MHTHRQTIARTGTTTTEKIIRSPMMINTQSGARISSFVSASKQNDSLLTITHG